MVFSMVAEIERDLISKRTKEVLQAKKANGVKLGRLKGAGKSKLDIYKVEIEALINNGSTKKFIAKRYETSESNLFNWVNKNGLLSIDKLVKLKALFPKIRNLINSYLEL